MNLKQTPIRGLAVLVSKPFEDHRGRFSRLFCQRELATVISKHQILQINHSRTIALGAIRGLHFQYPPYAEMKLVRCLKGRVWDVAVDLRSGSSTFLHWHAEELSPENGRMIIIPEGFAHGFQVLEANSELLYLHTEFYTPEAEGGVAWNDPTLAISWPLPAADLSDRDQKNPIISEVFTGISL